jgi:hypothetical protein
MPITMNNTTLTFNNGTTMTTAATGTVSSVATGNGLQGGTITTSGTLSIACPTFNTVGSYCYIVGWNQSTTVTSGSNYGAGFGNNLVRSTALLGFTSIEALNNLSGTWKWMGSTATGASPIAIGCRVS